MSRQRDSAATRQRILIAATSEFAQHGLAGARIDRIAQAASANKSLIYSYFGKKEKLFDHVMEAAIRSMPGVPATSVSNISVEKITRDDPVYYPAVLFDFLCANPEVVRLYAWRRLERPTASKFELDVYQARSAELTEILTGLGISDPLLAANIFSIAMGIVVALVGRPTEMLGESPLANAAQRRTMISAVRALVASEIANAK